MPQSDMIVVQDTLPARPQSDIARDAGRKPFEVLEFLGVAQGMTTLDVIASSGYYTEALANVVGLEGRVYAQNPAVALRFYAGRNDRALNQRLFGNRLPNVRRLDREFDDLGLGGRLLSMWPLPRSIFMTSTTKVLKPPSRYYSQSKRRWLMTGSWASSITRATKGRTTQVYIAC